MHKDNRDHNSQRQHKIYPMKTHLGEKFNNLFLREILQFNKRYNYFC